MLAGANVSSGILFLGAAILSIGAGAETDALFASLAVPTVLLSIVAATVPHVLVPLLGRLDEEALRNAAWYFAVLAAAFCGLSTAGLYLSIDVWVPLLFSGLPERGVALAKELSKPLVVANGFLMFATALSAVHRARLLFVRNESLLLAANLVALAFLPILLARFGVYGVPWAMLIRAVLQNALLCFVLGRFRWERPPSDLVRTAWKRIVPLLWGATLFKSTPLIDRVIASLAVPGQLSLFVLSFAVVSAGLQVVDRMFAAPLTAQLTRLLDASTTEAPGGLVRRAAWLCGATVMVGYAVAMVGGAIALAMDARIGALSQDDVRSILWILGCLAGVAVGGALGQIANAGYYACGETRRPTVVSIVGFVLSVPLKLIGFWFAGVTGLALATSVYFLGVAIVKMHGLRHVRSLRS